MAWVGTDAWTGAQAWGEHGGVSGDVAFTVTATVTAAAAVTRPVTATVTATGTVTAVGNYVTGSPTTLTGTAALTAIGDIGIVPVLGEAALTGTATVAAAAEVREPADLTFVASSAWVAPASSTTVSPTYPAGLVEFDTVYAVLHIKPHTATVATPANWSLVGSEQGGGGAQGAGTGLTRIHVYKRTVPSGGLTGSQAFTITGGSSPVGHMQAWRSNGTGLLWDTETLTFYSRSGASTAAGGTGGANVVLGPKDALIAVVGTPDDTTTNLNITNLAATGATLNALVKAPSAAQNTNATIVNAQGNDVAAASAYAVVASGVSTAAPSVTCTANASETGMGLFFRVSATRIKPTTHSADASLTGTGAITSAGVIVTVHTGQATVAATATITADAVVTGPPTPTEQSAEPGYGQPGAFYVGAVYTTHAMGGGATVDAQAALTGTATITAIAAVTRPSAAAVTATAGLVSAGEWWGAPRGLGATPISATRIDLDWDAVPTATGYDIERDSVVIVRDVAGTTYTDESGLVGSTTYSYRVAAVH